MINEQTDLLRDLQTCRIDMSTRVSECHELEGNMGRLSGVPDLSFLRNKPLLHLVEACEDSQVARIVIETLPKLRGNLFFSVLTGIFLFYAGVVVLSILLIIFSIWL